MLSESPPTCVLNWNADADICISVPCTTNVGVTQSQERNFSKLHFSLFRLRNIFDWVLQRVDRLGAKAAGHRCMQDTPAHHGMSTALRGRALKAKA